MKKTILSLVAVISTLGISAQTTTIVDVIRIYSSERTDDASTTVDESKFPIAEYQNSSSDKYRAELQYDGSIKIYKNSETTAINTYTNTTDVKYRAELQKIKISTDGTSKGHQYVNLGLTSGALWAKTNVGATTETGYGSYYAWGETTAYNSIPNAYPTSESLDWTTDKTNSTYLNLFNNNTIKDQYSWGYYKWGKGRANYSELYKYKDSDHATLESSDDAATANWGTHWCMPSNTQLTELVDKTTNYSITINGVIGWRFVNPKDESRYIFFPAAGWIYFTSGLSDVKDYGVYLSKDLAATDIGQAYQLVFSENYGYIETNTTDARCVGYSIRAIYTPPTPDPNIITGSFSVSATKKVQFAKSNLYWDGSEFHFEANQTDYTSSWDANHICHFYWTSLTDYQSGIYMPYDKTYSCSSQSNSDKFWCGEANPLTVDGTEGLYALTGGGSGEWEYLMSRRTNASSLYKDQVTVTNGGKNYNYCLIIAPDDFEGTLQSSYTLDEVNSLGLICLPAAGARREDNFTWCNEGGSYWTSSPTDTVKQACDLSFDVFLPHPVGVTDRYQACTMRLVKTVDE